MLDRLTQSCDPYLRIELCPKHVFPLKSYPPQTTITRKRSLDPLWGETFQLLVPEELFFLHGACLCLTVLDYDVLTYNDVAGQVFYPLALVPRLKTLPTMRLRSKPVVLSLIYPNDEQFSCSEHFKASVSELSSFGSKFAYRY